MQAAVKCGRFVHHRTPEMASRHCPVPRAHMHSRVHTFTHARLRMELLTLWPCPSPFAATHSDFTGDGLQDIILGSQDSKYTAPSVCAIMFAKPHCPPLPPHTHGRIVAPETRRPWSIPPNPSMHSYKNAACNTPTRLAAVSPQPRHAHQTGVL